MRLHIFLPTLSYPQYFHSPFSIIRSHYPSHSPSVMLLLRANHIFQAYFPWLSLHVIMQDLDPQVMKIFTQATCDNGKEATQRSGIDKLIPGANIDEFLFDPCGYSMNGYVKGVRLAFDDLKWPGNWPVWLPFFTGILYDHSYYSRAQLLVRQLRDQLPADFVPRPDQPTAEDIQSRPVHGNFAGERGTRLNWLFYVNGLFH